MSQYADVMKVGGDARVDSESTAHDPEAAASGANVGSRARQGLFNRRATVATQGSNMTRVGTSTNASLNRDEAKGDYEDDAKE